MNRNEWDLFERLRMRYGGDDYVLFPQVPDGTGMNKRRTADAVAMNLWPSRGLALEGFEFKASRSDLLTELKNSSKADTIGKYCEKWWIVVTDQKIVKDVDELPGNWGLLVPSGDVGLRIKKQAKRNQHIVEPTRRFMAGMFRAARHERDREIKKATREAGIDAARQEGYESGRRAEMDTMSRQSGRAQQQLGELQQIVDKFQQDSGVTLNRWEAGDIGKPLRAFMKLQRGSRESGHVQTAAANLLDAAKVLAEYLNPEGVDDGQDP